MPDNGTGNPTSFLGELGTSKYIPMHYKDGSQFELSIQFAYCDISNVNICSTKCIFVDV